jgi:hypothetical protein
VQVAEHAKPYFGMTTIHKEIASYLVDAVQSQPDQVRLRAGR